MIFEVYAACCRNYNVQLDKHLAIYGSTAKTLFGSFTTKQVQSSSLLIQLSNNVFGFKIGGKKDDIKIFELGPVINNAGKI